MINKRGQSLGLSIISCIAIIIVGFLLLNFLPDEIERGLNNLDCSNTENITDGTKLLCLAEYIIVPYWIWIIMAVAIGAITVRYVL